MPVNKNAQARFRIIDQCINDKRHRYPSLEYLAERCSEMLHTDISTSTIEKDLAAMKQPYPVGHSAPIVYSKQHKGYAYSEIGFSINELNLQDEEWNALKFSAQLLYQYRNVPIFADFKSAIDRINTRFYLDLGIEEKIMHQSVQFEKSVAENGQEWIHQIYDAIKSRHSIQFSYNNIYKKKTADYTIVPYLLKENRNRWYIIGWEESRQDYLTFALDRVNSIQTISIPQKRRNDFHPDSFFQHATGIMEGNSKPVNAELAITEPISKLVLLEPIHPSQKLISEKNGVTRISINVYANEEFYLRILSLGPNCTVIKPLSLRKHISDMIKKMGKNYNSSK
jgi:predicted DNA-binding transcriptional regulator YafY